MNLYPPPPNQRKRRGNALTRRLLLQMSGSPEKKRPSPQRTVRSPQEEAIRPKTMSSLVQQQLNHEKLNFPLLPTKLMSKSIGPSALLPMRSPAVLREAELVWNGFLSDLRSRGKDIHYKDLVALSDIRDPPFVLVPLVSYINILLGLAPTWQAAKRNLFKELIPLQKFLQEVAKSKFYEI